MEISQEGEQVFWDYLGNGGVLSLNDKGSESGEDICIRVEDFWQIDLNGFLVEELL